MILKGSIVLNFGWMKVSLDSNKEFLQEHSAIVSLVGRQHSTLVSTLAPDPAAPSWDHSPDIFFKKIFQCCRVNLQHTAYTVDSEKLN